MTTTYKPAFSFQGQAEPATNAQVFATYEEALASARLRFSVWTMPTGYTVVESTDPVNYRFDAEQGDVSLN